jgi:hypothetical protein
MMEILPRFCKTNPIISICFKDLKSSSYFAAVLADEQTGFLGQWIAGVPLQRHCVGFAPTRRQALEQ